MIWIKRISAVIGAIAVLAGLIFGINTYETKFATAQDIENVRADIELLGERLENKIQEDRIHAIQERIWKLEDRYGGVMVPKAPPSVLEHYRELRYQLELAKAKIKRDGT
jgi:hypothetical protein